MLLLLTVMIDHSPLLKSAGIKVDGIYIPPFEIATADILLIELPGGPLFLNQLEKVTSILSDNASVNLSPLNPPFLFAPHFNESKWRSLLFPITVGEYLKKKSNPVSELSTLVFDTLRVEPRTRIVTLPGTSRKILSILTTLTWSNRIIFDLCGVDLIGSEKVFAIVKTLVGTNGAAILIDYTDHFADRCTSVVKYV